MIGFVISAVVTTGLGLATTVIATATTVAVNVTVNVTIAVARFGYGYIRGWRGGYSRDFADVRSPEMLEPLHENSDELEPEQSCLSNPVQDEGR